MPVTTIREAMLLRELRHPNVLHLHAVHIDTWQEGSFTLSLVFEFVDHDVHEMMQCQKGFGAAGQPRLPVQHFPGEMVRSMLWQLLQGLAYLHQSWIIHRDLKPSNLLVSGVEHPKPGAPSPPIAAAGSTCCSRARTGMPPTPSASAECQHAVGCAGGAGRVQNKSRQERTKRDAITDVCACRAAQDCGLWPCARLPRAGAAAARERRRGDHLVSRPRAPLRHASLQHRRRHVGRGLHLWRAPHPQRAVPRQRAPPSPPPTLKISRFCPHA